MRKSVSVKRKEPDLVRRPNHGSVIARHDDAKQRDHVRISERQCQDLGHRRRVRCAERRGDVRGSPDGNARDTDNNSADWVTRTLRDPQNASSAQELP